MKAFIRTLILWIALTPGLVAAQTYPTIPDHTVIGRLGSGSSSGPSQAVPFSSLGAALSPYMPAIPGTPGVDANILNAQTSAYSAATSDCGRTITLGGSAFYTLTIGAASGFAATCSIIISNIDTGRAKKMSINGITYPNGGFLWPGQTTTIKNVNNVWTVTSNPGPWRLTASLTLYADSSNGSNSGSTDCLASGTSACATATYASALFCQYIRKNGQSVTIQLPTGINQVENLSLCSYTSDEALNQATAPIITGNAIVPASGQPVVAVNVNTPWLFSSIAIQAPSTSVTCIEADVNSFIYLASVTFYTCGIAMQMLNHGKIELNGPLTLNSALNTVAITQDGGEFLAGAGYQITCGAGFSYSNVFAQAYKNSTQVWIGTTFSGCGSVTGSRYSATLGGGIDTNGGGASFFPGNSGGTATSPGWYN
jgi:hypothetical protein